MILDNWTPFWKIDSEDHTRCMAQQTYEPLINPERTVFCANYDWANKYQRHEDPVREKYTQEVVDWFWENELYHILKYQDKEYMPKVIDVDHDKRRIFFRWQGETCNEIIYSGRNLDDYCPTWREQIKHIFVDLHNEGTYKLTMYPHCHYIEDGQIKAIDWYGCIPVTNPLVDAKYMDGIVHETAKFRLAETGALIDNKYNLETMFKRSMSEHVTWGNQSMMYIYNEIFK